MRRSATVLIVEDNKVLAVSRGTDLNDWGLPGGKTNDDTESFEACARREAFEETGIRVYELTLVFEDTYSRLDGAKDTWHTQTFTPAKYYGEIKSSSEGQVEWKEPEVLMHGTFGEYNTKLFRAVGLVN